jgi:hypothetical protein
MARPLGDELGRFWKHVDATGSCWIWTGARTPYGYGAFGVRRNGLWKPIRSTRYSYMLRYGKIPDGLHVLHVCDNTACVKPEHLFLGTQADNLRDMTEKGRRRWNNPKGKNSGETNGRHKLTRKQVDEIRSRYIPRILTQRQLAREYGVDQSLVCDIVNNKIWRN